MAREQRYFRGVPTAQLVAVLAHMQADPDAHGPDVPGEPTHEAMIAHMRRELVRRAAESRQVAA